MDSKRKLHWGWGVVAAFVSAGLLFFSIGVDFKWWPIWLAPVPLLLVAPRLSARWGAVLAFAAWCAASLSLGRFAWRNGGLHYDSYFRDVLEIPLPVCVILVLYPACIFMMWVLLYRTFMRRGAVWAATFSVPCAGVALQYLVSVVSIHGTFGSLANTQVRFLPVLQMASLTGIWGITFCVLLFASALATICSSLISNKQRLQVAISAGAFFVAVFVFGEWRLHMQPAVQHSVLVGLVASDIPANVIPPHSPAATEKMFQDYAAQVRQLAANGAQVVVLPEHLAEASEANIAVVDGLLAPVAKQANVRILVGLGHQTANGNFNESRLYSPAGVVEATYHKEHLLPPWEDMFRPGTERTLVHDATGIWGLEICKDLDFENPSRNYGQDGVALMLAPAWDFRMDDWYHGSISFLRGVENGYAVVRSAKVSMLSATDDRGRELGIQPTSTAQPFTSLLVRVPVQHDRTLYTQWGDWFAWLNVVGFAALLMSIFYAPKRAGIEIRV